MRRRQFITGLGTVGALGATDLAAAQPANSTTTTGGGQINNVILAIGDGMGFDPIEITAHVHGDLALQSMTPVGLTRTFPRDGSVTDSAAAGTALATGMQAHNGQVSVRGPAGSEDVTPITTLLEVANQIGKATGLVSTTRITHATPAVFGSHIYDRDLERDIADQYLEQEVDVLLGGGRREWSRDQLDRASAAGYEILSDRSDLMAASSDQLLGLFDQSHVTYTLDRDDSIPSLLEMSQTAFDRLAGDDGCFLLIEGGRIDHAEHGNDIQTTVAETREFDEVVAWGREVVARRDDTLLIVTSDHETGGLATGDDYGAPLKTEAIRQANGSNTAIAAAIERGVPIREAVSRSVDVSLTDAEVERIDEARTRDSPYALSNTIGEVVSDHLGVTWASHNHTGPAQTVLAAGPGVTPATEWRHHTDLSATMAALVLFGQIPDTTDVSRSNWEQRITTSGPNGVHDAQLALQYVGPADSAVRRALDVNDDGFVDYADVLSIGGTAVTSASERAARPTRRRVSTDQYHTL